ncbi:hypothetical protein MWU59_10260 [Flavobacteriaceae bacterium F08102]|nr:hypothetical protein [Flavobacteriaceae bacterium F08102]
MIGGLAILLILSCVEREDNSSRNINDEDIVLAKSIIGKTLPPWEEGYLDIHAINTGRGESTLLIFPDGTTMLVDAAGSLISPLHEIPPPAQKPNNMVSPGLAITNYAKHFVKPASNKLNYLMVSHFHSDHMGGYSDDLPMDPSGSFRMSGITEVGANINFDIIFDRDYPTYNYPINHFSNPMMVNYINFLNWAKTAYGAKAERFVAGKNDQIVLKRNPSKYPNFKVQNLISNGIIWTGIGTEAKNVLPSVEDLVIGKAPENIFSIGLELSYGKFNYFTAGDLQYNGRSDHAWKDIEAPLSKIVNPVDVMKSNHHGTANCNGDVLLGKLIPKVVLSHSWRDVHPNPETVTRMFAANSASHVFTTNMTEANKARFGSDLTKIKSMQGHIVVRVKPGGASYTVYVLDDSNQEYNVVKTFGPYQAN